MCGSRPRDARHRRHVARPLRRDRHLPALDVRRARDQLHARHALDHAVLPGGRARTARGGDDAELYEALARAVRAESEFVGDNGRPVNAELRKLVRNDGVLYADDGDTQTVSQMLEFAISFQCVARLAARYRDEALAAQMRRYAQVYRRLYDNASRLYTGLLRAARELPDPRPRHASNTFLFTEGSQMHGSST